MDGHGCCTNLKKHGLPPYKEEKDEREKSVIKEKFALSGYDNLSGTRYEHFYACVR